MLRIGSGHAFLLALALCAAAPLTAQSSNAADSLKAEVAKQRAILDRKDSTWDGYSAYEACIHLAALTARTEAIDLLKQAGAIADSLERPDLGARAHRMLAARFAEGGQFAAAYAEALRVDSFERRQGVVQADRMGEANQLALDRLTAKQDSTNQAVELREQESAQTIAHLQSKAAAWMFTAIALLLGALATVLILLYRTGRATSKMRAAIEGLRAEVEQLRNRVAKPEVVRPKVEAVAAPTSVDEAMKPVVTAMFGKDAPERLATLRDARQRGDVEKVLRVLASLKPQLYAFDADRFTPLLTRLRAQDAPGNALQWANDLDAIEAGLEELLQGNRSQ